MPLENRENQSGQVTYTRCFVLDNMTVPASDHQENVNYAFPQTPPPKYEDVISGRYLNSDYRIYDNQTTNGIHHSTGPQVAPVAQTRSDPSNLEVSQKKTCKGAGAILLFALILTLILILRVTIKMS